MTSRPKRGGDKDFVTTVLKPKYISKSVTMGEGCQKLCDVIFGRPTGQNAIVFFSAVDVSKTYKLLVNPKTAYIKKRQIMRTSFGDYRAKMEKEEKKFKLGNLFSYSSHLGKESDHSNCSLCLGAVHKSSMYGVIVTHTYRHTTIQRLVYHCHKIIYPLLSLIT